MVDPSNTILDAQNNGRVLNLNCSSVNADLAVVGITFQNGNVTGTQGAGLVIRTNGNAIANNNIISGNVHNNSAGAGAAIFAHGIVNINNNIFSNNVGPSVAGLLASFAEELSIVGNIITNNSSSEFGGAIISENNTVTLSNNTISTNTGSGLRIIHGGTLNFIKNKVNDNIGQGINIVEFIDIFMEGNEISGNSSNYGGGIWIRGKLGGTQLVTMINNIIINNNAVYDGGGIIMMENLGFGAGVLKKIFLANNTIVNNQAGGNGGGLYLLVENYSSTSSIYNNIILNNNGNLGDDIFIDNNPHGNPTPSGSVNLYNNDFDRTNGFFIKVDDGSVIYSNNLDNETPSFVDPANNDYHLNPDSPCIDAGMDAGVYDDFDGDTRPQGIGFDIGADEYVGTSTIETILIFFDQSVADGTLTGYGNGNSANGRLNALRNMLETVSDLIDIDDIEGACKQLRTVSRKCDRESPPPDFVTGEAVGELNDRITELMAKLGCE